LRGCAFTHAAEKGLLAGELPKKLRQGLKQAAEKGLFSNEHCEKHTPGAKALVDFAGFVPGLKSRPTARTSFSAA
jgi:hypothetical protein